MLKTSPSNAGDAGLIPGGDLRSHMPHGQKTKTKQNQYFKKLNKDLKKEKVYIKKYFKKGGGGGGKV